MLIDPKPLPGEIWTGVIILEFIAASWLSKRAVKVRNRAFASWNQHACGEGKDSSQEAMIDDASHVRVGG